MKRQAMTVLEPHSLPKNVLLLARESVSPQTDIKKVTQADYNPIVLNGHDRFTQTIHFRKCNQTATLQP